MTRIVGIGSPLVDVIARVHDDFITHHAGGEKGGMQLVEHDALTELIATAEQQGTVTTAAGGSAANTVIGTAHLGMSAAFVGKIAHDAHGALLCDAFAAAGCDTHLFQYTDTTATGVCVSLVTPDAERTMRTHLGAAAELTADDIATIPWQKGDHVHIEGYVLLNEALAFAALRSTKAAGCTISLDLASFEVVRATKTILPDVLHDYVDMVFANDDEAAAFVTGDPDDACKQFARYCRIAAVKCGENGAYIGSNTHIEHIPALTVSACDSTGAGDAWAAGFLYGHFAGYEHAHSGRIAAACGAAVVQIIGAALPHAVWQRCK